MNYVYIHYYNVEGARPIYSELINAIQSCGLYERVERIVDKPPGVVVKGAIIVALMELMKP